MEESILYVSKESRISACTNKWSRGDELLFLPSLISIPTESRDIVAVSLLFPVALLGAVPQRAPRPSAPLREGSTLPKRQLEKCEKNPRPASKRRLTDGGQLGR